MKNHLKPCVPVDRFREFGFRKCKGMYGRNGCYYMLVAADNKMLFVSKEIFMVFDIADDDPRIHKNKTYAKTKSDSYTVVKYLTEKGFFNKGEDMSKKNNNSKAEALINLAILVGFSWAIALSIKAFIWLFTGNF